MPGVTENKNPFSSLPRLQIATPGKATQEVTSDGFNVNAVRKLVTLHLQGFVRLKTERNKLFDQFFNCIN